MPTKAVFDELAGAQFRISVPSGPGLDVILAEVTSLGPPRQIIGSEPMEPFSLIFRGPPQIVLCQGTYGVEHEKLGKLDIFLVPIGPDRMGMRFQAIFN